MNDRDLIFEAYRQINEQPKNLRLFPAYAQEYGGGGDFPNAPAGGALRYGYVFGNTPEESDTFIRSVLQKLKTGPNPTLKRIQPVNRSGQEYRYYYDGTPESFSDKVMDAMKQQIQADNRTASNSNIKYGLRIFLNKVLKKDFVPGEGGQNVTYVDGDDIPAPQVVAAAANPPEQLQAPEPQVPAATETPTAETPPAAEKPKNTEFKLHDRYELQSSDDIRIPPDMREEYDAVIRDIGAGMTATGSDIVNKLRELTGSYTDAKRVANQLFELGALTKQEDQVDDAIENDKFDPFSEIEDETEYDIDKVIADIEKDRLGGRTRPGELED